MTDSLAAIQAKLQSQGAAKAHLDRIARVRQLAEQSPHCLGVALVGSFAQNRGDRISDLDLAAFVTGDREVDFMREADEVLDTNDVMNVYGRALPGEVAFRKYVYLDFSSCEFHVFNQRSRFKLRLPYVPVWDPGGYLSTLVIDEPPPSHETFEPYPHGDDGLIWELMDCIKWLSRGRTQLAKSYLSRLGAAIGSQNAA